MQSTQRAEIDDIAIFERVGCCAQPEVDVCRDNIGIDVDALGDQGEEIVYGHEVEDTVEQESL